MATVTVLLSSIVLLLWRQRRRRSSGTGCAAPILSVAWRDREFPALRRLVFLDYAGTALPSATQVRAAAEDLVSGATLLANPHGGGPASAATQRRIERARREVLAWFGADPQTYAVVFTAGATASLRLVGDCFPWEAGGEFRASHECHNSLLGLREQARAAGAVASTFPLSAAASVAVPSSPHRSHRSLLAFPAECNATGVQTNWRALTRRAHAAGWRVLLDASKHVATAPLALDHRGDDDDAETLPDFVCLSFYKMFGSPTGLGALLVRRDNGASRQLHEGKRYFGGGAVAAASARTATRVPRSDSVSAWLEDGTLPFLAIVALAHGFEALRCVGGMHAIETRAFGLALRLARGLALLRHANGQRLVRLHGRWEQMLRDGSTSSSTAQRQGPVVMFSLFGPDPLVTRLSFSPPPAPPRRGSTQPPIGCAAVNRVCALHGIQIRTGCFCNPGACEVALELTEAELDARIATLRAESDAAAAAAVAGGSASGGAVCWDDTDLIEASDCDDGSTLVHSGACRASIGYPSMECDVDTLVELLRTSFCASAAEAAGAEAKADRSGAAVPRATLPVAGTMQRARLSAIYVFPIKSCAAMRVKSWSVDAGGLRFDRCWAVVEYSAGTTASTDARAHAWSPRILSQKQLVELARIVPTLDLERKELSLRCESAEGMRAGILHLPLEPDSAVSKACDVVLGNRARRSANAYTDDATLAWFRAVCGRDCTLAVVATSQSDCTPGTRFMNEDGSILMVSEASVKHLGTAMGEGRRPRSTNFRPNLVIAEDADTDGLLPHDEDCWRTLRFVAASGSTSNSSSSSSSSAGGGQFAVMAPCSRCHMVDIGFRLSSGSGEDDDAESPMRVLSTYRRKRASILFGVYLRAELATGTDEVQVCEGMEMHVEQIGASFFHTFGNRSC